MPSLSWIKHINNNNNKNNIVRSINETAIRVERIGNQVRWLVYKERERASSLHGWQKLTSVQHFSLHSTLHRPNQGRNRWRLFRTKVLPACFCKQCRGERNWNLAVNKSAWWTGVLQKEPNVEITIQKNACWSIRDLLKKYLNLRPKIYN